VDLDAFCAREIQAHVGERGRRLGDIAAVLLIRGDPVADLEDSLAQAGVESGAAHVLVVIAQNHGHREIGAVIELAHQ